MNLKITIDSDSITIPELVDRLGDVSSNITKELNIVANKVATKCKSIVAKQIVKHYRTTQAKIRKSMFTKRYGLRREITFIAKTEWPVKYVKHKHTKAGVKAEPLKDGMPAIFPTGFKGPKPGKLAEKLHGHAFKRTGKSRKPIEVLKVASPINIASSDKVVAPTVEEIKNEFQKQLAERLRYKTLVAEGKISGRKV